MKGSMNKTRKINQYKMFIRKMRLIKEGEQIEKTSIKKADSYK
jgi:hypothetical protein